MTIAKDPSHGVQLGTSPKSNHTFSLYAESLSTRRGSVHSIHDASSFPNLQRRLIDAAFSQALEPSRTFVPPRITASYQPKCMKKNSCVGEMNLMLSSCVRSAFITVACILAAFQVAFLTTACVMAALL